MKLLDRYEISETLGKGGMGVVYRAYDKLMRREVAVKTLLDVDNQELLELFYKEAAVLKSMVHPNVIGVFDIGELEEDGVRKPFFVMPLLPGKTLDRLIRDRSGRLTVETAVQIISQAARGLHAAHEMGLVHRDVKPSNIFVLDDDTVKIIDFGIARAASLQSRTGLKGTIFYMAPEQLEMKPPTPLSDQFALAVCCYEVLTRRRPFAGATEGDVAEAILRHTPPPVTELNPAVPYSVSQVLHKAMAKQARARFSDAREFAKALSKALRREAIEYFDPARIRPRLERVRQSLEKGDLAFSSELLTELENEGQLDPEIASLRAQINEAQKHEKIKQLLETAKRFLDAGEHQVALRKVQDALDLNPEDPFAAELRDKIEKSRRQTKATEWLALARQHLANSAFREARSALENAAKASPNDPDVAILLAETSRAEREFNEVQERKSNLYRQAMEDFERQDLSSAESKLDELLSMEQRSPETDGARSASYRALHERVVTAARTLRDGYEEARTLFDRGDLQAALSKCDSLLAQHPEHALLRALRFDIEERRRLGLSAAMSEVDSRLAETRDLADKVKILEEALRRHPGESHFDHSLKLLRDKLDLVNSVVRRANSMEEKGRFADALDQWEVVRSVDPAYSGLDLEIERVRRRRESQQREAERASRAAEIDALLDSGDFTRAGAALEDAMSAYPDDAALSEMRPLIEQRRRGAAQAGEALARGRAFAHDGNLDQAITSYRQAVTHDPGSAPAKALLAAALLDSARRPGVDPAKALAAAEEALSIEPHNAAAEGLRSHLRDTVREEFVSWTLAQSRRLEARGDREGAAAVIVYGQSAFTDVRLENRRNSLSGLPPPPVTPPPPPVPPLPDPQADTVPMRVPRRIEDPGKQEPPVAQTKYTTEEVVFQAKRSFDTRVFRTSTSSGSIPVVTPPPAHEPVPQPAPAPIAPPPAPRRSNWIIGLIAMVITAAVASAILYAVVTYSRSKNAAEAPAPTGRAILSAQPAQAEVYVDGRQCGFGSCDTLLAPGSHKVEAKLDGYVSAARQFDVTQDSPANITLSLAPAEPRVMLSSAPSGASVSVDGKPVANLTGTPQSVAGLTSGDHAFTIARGLETISFTIRFAPGAPPSLDTGILRDKGEAAIILGLGGALRAYSSDPGTQVTLDGQKLGVVTQAGLFVPGLAQGAHTVEMMMPVGGKRTLRFDSDHRPTISAVFIFP